MGRTFAMTWVSSRSWNDVAYTTGGDFPPRTNVQKSLAPCFSKIAVARNLHEGRLTLVLALCYMTVRNFEARFRHRGACPRGTLIDSQKERSGEIVTTGFVPVGR